MSAEAMAAGCTVIGDAGFLPKLTVDDIVATLENVLNGHRPTTEPIDRARRYDWDAVADQAETTYQAAVDSEWEH